MENTAKAQRDNAWVNRYAKGITVIGGIVVLAGLVYSALAVYGTWLAIISKWNAWLAATTFFSAAAFIVIGLLVMGLGSLLRYVFGERQEPGWILRHAEKGLYLLPVFPILSNLLLLLASGASAPVGCAPGTAAQATVNIISGVILAPIWIALGLVLRRALPVIEESRTLV